MRYTEDWFLSRITQILSIHRYLLILFQKNVSPHMCRVTLTWVTRCSPSLQDYIDARIHQLKFILEQILQSARNPVDRFLTERKTRIESRSERANTFECNSANTFRLPLERTRPPLNHPCEIRPAPSWTGPSRPRAMCGQRCAFLRLAEPENDDACATFLFTGGKGPRCWHRG